MAYVMCRNPYTTSGGMAYGCGQCLPCRINKRRVWQHRIILEAQNNKDNAFVTLTYRDDCLPLSDTGLATLDRRDLKLFFMRLNTEWHRYQKRMRVNEVRGIRYFACGEYGDKSWRPHYHVMLFGVPTCVNGNSDVSCYNSRAELRKGACGPCRDMWRVWGKGKAHLGNVEGDSAGYVAQYVTKKLTNKEDDLLCGRYPEFAVMSRRPGIGYDALWELADWFMRIEKERPLDDVFNKLGHGKSHKLPMGRYLRQKLRLMVGRDEKAPESVLAEMVAELSEVYARAKDVTKAPGMRQAFRYVFADMVIATDEGKAARQAYKLKLRQSKRGKWL